MVEHRLTEKRRPFGGFLALFALGMIGVLSLPFGMAPLLDAGPASGIDSPSRNARVAMMLLQPTLLLVLAIAIGSILAPRVGLASLIDRTRPAGRVRRCAPIALAWGIALAIAISIADVFVFRAYFKDSAAAVFGRDGAASTLTAMLYGGITEEIIARWGLMSLLVWLGWRLFQRERERPSDAVFYAAIAVAAVCFAFAHLPLAMHLGTLSTPLVARVVVLNMAAGAVFGWLFWRHNLETAMMAHAALHAGVAALSIVGML